MTHLPTNIKCILKKRLERAQAAMQTAHVDVWISIGRETHLLGEPALVFLTPSLVFMRTALILAKDGRSIVLCHSVESEELEATGVYSDVVIYRTPDEFKSKLLDIIANYAQATTIALNTSPLEATSDGLSHSDFLLINDMLRQLNFAGKVVSSYEIMREVRAHKCPEEVAAIENAVNCAMDIYDRARPLIKLGMSGKDIQKIFQRLTLEAGFGFSWDSCYNPYVSVGARSSYNCKMPPDDVYIQPGDVINVDFGLRTGGFASDNQRTFYAAAGEEKRVPAEVQHAFETLKLINTRVAEAMKAGVDSNSLGQIGIDTMAEQGYGTQIRSYGHEIGIYAHNGGIGAGMHSANAGQNTALVENMTFTLEPAIITSRGRVCREDVVCVGSQRGRILGRQQDEIWLITE